MLDFIPFAGAWRKMTDRHLQTALISEFLQLPFPNSQSPSVTAPCIGSDQYPLGRGIDCLALRAPPPSDGGYCERTCVMIGSDVDKTRISSDVVNSIRVSTR